MKFLLNMFVVVACKSNDQMGCRRDRKGGRSFLFLDIMSGIFQNQLYKNICRYSMKESMML